MLPPLPPDAPKHPPLLLAYSGGLDSTVLLHVLANDAARRNDGLRAVHVHHGLHAEADAWVDHCQAFCEHLHIPLIVLRVEVDRESECGPEAAARHARYLAIADVMDEGEVLATAHHLDDQAETFLLRALRASGPEGLAAMRPWRAFGGGWQWRPLLDTPRADLLAYAMHHGLAWVEDPSNARTDFDRNFLRNAVFPLLQRRWPHAAAAFARSAALSAEAGDLLARQDAQVLAMAATADPAALAVPSLRAVGASQRARVLRRWIAGLGLPPLPAAGVAQIEAQLLEARTDAQASFCWQGAVVRRWRDLLHAETARPALPASWQASWEGKAPFVLPDGGRLTLAGHDAGFDAPLQLAARQGGERIRLPGRTHHHALKDVLQSLGVPPWERRQLPLLWCGGELWAAGDLVVSADFDAWLRARSARLVWQRG